MKVISAKEMARIEAAAFQEGASDAEYMERAGHGIADVVKELIFDMQLSWSVLLLCGKGNNAGDAYVAGTTLRKVGYEVRALQLAPFEECSHLCRYHGKRFRGLGGEVIEVRTPDDLDFFDEGVILDGVFGTGFHGEASGVFAAAIQAANRTYLPIISIDIPSGVNGNTGDVGEFSIRAACTIFLGLPKTGLFLGEAWNAVGILRHVDFGLEQKFVDEVVPDFECITEDMGVALLPPIVRTRHKYQAGYVVGLAGSPEMPGAALLSSLAALRSGAGMVRLLCPKEMEGQLVARPPEVIIEYFADGDELKVINALNHASAVFIGPGLTKVTRVRELLGRVISRIERPCVLDADALNLLAEEGWPLPEEVLLTPHQGEMGRLLGAPHRVRNLELLDACRAYAEDKHATILLKGGPSFIFSPGALPSVLPHGDAGMATAGCGDVLTGVLAALLAQGLHPLEAALLGGLVHALAGERAARILSSYSMIASDVTEHLPDVFLYLLGQE